MKKTINFLSVFTLVLFLSNCDNPTESESVHELVGQYVKIETILTIGSNVYNDIPGDNPKTLIKKFAGQGIEVINPLEEWELLSIVNASQAQEPLAPMSQIKVLPHKEKDEWNLIAKYNIGTAK